MNPTLKKRKPVRLALAIAIALCSPLGWAAENASNFKVEMKSPRIPVRYKSKEEARRSQQAKQQQLNKDIAKYKKAIGALLQKYQDELGEKFNLVDYMTDYAVVDSLQDPNYSACQTSQEACSYRFQYEDGDKWMIQVIVTFGKFPDQETMSKLQNDIAKSVLYPAAYEAYSKPR